jgi:hypothetical protein
MTDRVTVVTKCRNPECERTGAQTFPLPVSGDEFPMECKDCGQKTESPLRDGELDKIEARFAAQLALSRAGS